MALYHTGKVGVSSYTRTTKKGKVVHVKRYSQHRKLLNDILAAMSTNRPAVVGRPADAEGEFPHHRQFPNQPAPKVDVKKVARVNKATRRQVEKVQRDEEKKIPGSVKRLEKTGHTVEKPKQEHPQVIEDKQRLKDAGYKVKEPTQQSKPSPEEQKRKVGAEAANLRKKASTTTKKASTTTKKAVYTVTKKRGVKSAGLKRKSPKKVAVPPRRKTHKITPTSQLDPKNMPSGWDAKERESLRSKGGSPEQLAALMEFYDRAPRAAAQIKALRNIDLQDENDPGYQTNARYLRPEEGGPIIDVDHNIISKGFFDSLVGDWYALYDSDYSFEQASIMHEAGHHLFENASMDVKIEMLDAVATLVGIDDVDKTYPVWDEAKKQLAIELGEEPSNEEVDKVAFDVRAQLVFMEHAEELRDYTSDYGGSSYHEFFAEAYAEYATNPNSRDIPRILGETLEKVANSGRREEAPGERQLRARTGGPMREAESVREVGNEDRSQMDVGAQERGLRSVLALIPHNKRGKGTGKGTIDDPINCRGDVQLAARLLAEGKHIRLNKASKVGTLLDKLAAMVEEAKQKGEEAPVFDLCKVSVPKTNLFCAESKGIPRAKMPQLGGHAVPGTPAAGLPVDKKGEVDVTEPFIEELQKHGIKITEKIVPAAYLKASQSELDGPKVAGMSRAMEAGKIPDAPIFVTRDGYIIDGHHRWASKVAIDVKDGHLGDILMPVRELDMEIGEALDFANAFTRMYGIAPKGLGATAEGLKSKSKKKQKGGLLAFIEEAQAMQRAMDEDNIRAMGGKKEALRMAKAFASVGFKSQAPLRSEERQALFAYQGMTYTEINPALRHGDTMPPDFELQADALKEAIRHSQSEKPTVLYRGLESQHEDFVPGAIITDKGFASTSKDFDIASGFGPTGTVLKIHVPAGAHALDVDEATREFGGETEMLMAPGSRLRITSVTKIPLAAFVPGYADKSKNFRVVVEADLINDGFDEFESTTPLKEKIEAEHVVESMRLSDFDIPPEALQRTYPVSEDEYQLLAGAGKNRLADYEATKHNLKKLDQYWTEVRDESWDSTRSPWGGTTIDTITATPLKFNPEGRAKHYAVTIKPPGMDSVSIPIDADRATFDAAMDEAREKFGGKATWAPGVLKWRHAHLGVFRDEEAGRIDIDPVLVLTSLDEAREIGAYTRAKGGAYCFEDGLGYWSPYVEEEDHGRSAVQGPGPVVQRGQEEGQAEEDQPGLQGASGGQSGGLGSGTSGGGLKSKSPKPPTWNEKERASLSRPFDATHSPGKLDADIGVTSELAAQDKQVLEEIYDRVPVAVRAVEVVHEAGLPNLPNLPEGFMAVTHSPNPFSPGGIEIHLSPGLLDTTEVEKNLSKHPDSNANYGSKYTLRQSAFIHELGHVISMNLDEESKDVLCDFIAEALGFGYRAGTYPFELDDNSVSALPTDTDEQRAYRFSEGRRMWDFMLNRDLAQSAIGDYGGNSWREFVAECYAEYVTNGGTQDTKVESKEVPDGARLGDPDFVDGFYLKENGKWVIDSGEFGKSPPLADQVAYDEKWRNSQIPPGKVRPIAIKVGQFIEQAANSGHFKPYGSKDAGNEQGRTSDAGKPGKAGKEGARRTIHASDLPGVAQREKQRKAREARLKEQSKVSERSQRQRLGLAVKALRKVVSDT